MFNPKTVFTSFIDFIILLISNLIEKFIHQQLYVGKIVFNCAWEDPAIDLKALKLTKEDKIVVITSAGCNVLTYALHNPKAIYSVDRNPCQNALLELKIAGIKVLDYDTFWEVFGRGRYPGFSTVIYPKLRPLLSTASRAFWDSHAHYFNGKGLRNSFYYRGCSGFLAWVIIKIYCRMVPGLQGTLKGLFQVQSLEEQKQAFKSLDRQMFGSTFVTKGLKNPMTLTCMTGVPRPQQKLLEEEGGVVVFLKKAMEELFNETKLQDNYFYKVYVDGEYSKQCCPEYLKEENFKKLKAGAVDCISVHTTTITEFLKNKGDTSITRFILLDHMDWLSQSPEILQEEWQTIMDHSAPNSKYLWRSAGRSADFVIDTKVTRSGTEVKVGDLVVMRPEISEPLHVKDRVHTYTSFHVADLKAY